MHYKNSMDIVHVMVSMCGMHYVSFGTQTLDVLEVLYSRNQQKLDIFLRTCFNH